MSRKKMAHRKNPGLLRSSLWRNPVFCTYTRSKQRRTSWTKKVKRLNRTTSFSRKIFIRGGTKNKNFFAGGKKNTSLLKLARGLVLSSHYRNKIIPVMSKATPLSMQNVLNKLNKQRVHSQRRRIHPFPLGIRKNTNSHKFLSSKREATQTSSRFAKSFGFGKRMDSNQLYTQRITPIHSKKKINYSLQNWQTKKIFFFIKNLYLSNFICIACFVCFYKTGPVPSSRREVK